MRKLPAPKRTVLWEDNSAGHTSGLPKDAVVEMWKEHKGDATVIDAIRDGWRVISFPNMALSLDENRTYGLGFEFILERWH